MTAQSGQGEHRQVLPRWRSFANTLRTGELNPLSTVSSSDDEVERTRQAAKAVSGSYGHAEIFSIFLARASVEDARHEATLLLELPNIPVTVRREALRLLDDTRGAESEALVESGAAAKQLGITARARVRRRVQDPIAWVDLALAHTIQGLAGLAEREMQVAVQLAPDSRFVLRSAARLLVHKDRADEANFLLNSSARVSEDPWLLAAELSTAQLAFGKARRTSEGRAMAAHGPFAPHSISELTSELATTELISGRDRQSRLLFGQSLSDPTENAIAQAVSQANRTNLQFDSETLNMSRGYEARALEHARQGEWPAATEEAGRWLEDQPFSQEPYRFASFTTSFGSADYVSAARIAMEGLRLHPDDKMLRNNAAYALANMDRPAEARRFIQIPPEPTTEDALTQLATMGLIYFREGDAETGARLYRIAIAGLEKLRRRDMAGIAASHLALEEMRLGLPAGGRSAERALKLVRQLNYAERSVLESRLSLAHGTSANT